jgi:serine/threonine-protein kinase
LHEHVTFLRPEPPPSDPRRISAALPADLLEQVRERVRLLAVFLLIGFAVDPVLYFGSWAVARLSGYPISPESSVFLGFQLAQSAACAASAALWWVARNRRISASRLHTLGLAYEIVICFVLAITTFWNDFLKDGALPSLTWIPVIIILFPLILPGPPARMLAASIAAGATAPLALALLDLLNKVSTTLNNYVQTIFASTLAVGFAVMGARIVYRLGREVIAARELGSYSLEERLGEGGMGEVWRARHRMLARPAAIKLIHPSIAGHVDIGVSEEAMRRFEREAQVIARLRSPHTIDLFDFGIADNGAFYYATRGVAVPAALDDLVLSCLAKDPNDRPQSARALSSRLAGIDGSTVWTEDRARGWWAQYQSIRATG